MTVTALDGKGGAPNAAEPKKSKLKLFIIIGVVALVALGAAYKFVLAPDGDGKKVEQPGLVFPLDSIQINLADGHYLKLTVAVQGIKGTKELDGSKALDAAIDMYSGQTVTKLSDKQYYNRMKEKYAQRLEKLYPDEVMGVYFTEFVVQ